MYDNAVAMKAGNYGLFQVATAKLKNFKPYRIPRMWGVLARSLSSRSAAGIARRHQEARDASFCSGGSPARSVGVSLLVSLMTFALIWLVPGDPASAFLDASATPEQVERLRVELGLDRPLPLQMVDWYGRMLQRRSRAVDAAQPQRRPPRILERLPVTLSLAGLCARVRCRRSASRPGSSPPSTTIAGRIRR